MLRARSCGKSFLAGVHTPFSRPGRPAVARPRPSSRKAVPAGFPTPSILRLWMPPRPSAFPYGQAAPGLESSSLDRGFQNAERSRASIHLFNPRADRSSRRCWRTCVRTWKYHHPLAPELAAVRGKNRLGSFGWCVPWGGMMYELAETLPGSGTSSCYSHSRSTPRKGAGPYLRRRQMVTRVDQRRAGAAGGRPGRPFHSGLSPCEP
jgi:hypothetical protein